MSSGDAAATPATVLCAGIAVHDQIFLLDAFPVPGSKNRARQFATAIGGCATNGGVAMVRLGARVRVAAPLGGPPGEDAIGDRIVADLTHEGIDCAGVVREAGARSPISAILVDASGERLIVNDRDEALSAVRVPDPAAAVADVDAVLIDNRFAEFVLPVAHAARARDIPVVIDADRPTRETDALLNAASHVVFAADGLRATTGLDDLGESLRRIAARTRSFLAVTDGPKGSWWWDDGTVRHVPAFAVEAVDTLGAGDVYHGAFTLALAEGRDEPAAMRFAAAAAAVKCTRFGGISGAPTRAEVEAFLAARAT